MIEELRDAVERAYGVFSGYRPGRQLLVCRCNVCVDAACEAQLLTTPLREIDRFLLAEYTHSAHGWLPGEEDQLRYFLPRYFELIAAGEDPCHYGEALGRLRNVSTRQDWPVAEADAVDGFFAALLRDRLLMPLDPPNEYTHPLFDDRAAEVLALIVDAGADVAPALLAWEATRDRSADLRLAELVLFAERASDRKRGPFGQSEVAPVEAQMRAVERWLFRPATRLRLEEACLRESEPGACWLLSRAEALVGGATGAPPPAG